MPLSSVWVLGLLVHQCDKYHGSLFLSSAGVTGLPVSSQEEPGIKDVSLPLGLVYLCHIVGSAAELGCPPVRRWLVQ